MENELTENGLGNVCSLFPNEKSIILMPDNICYTLDRVYAPDTLQVIEAVKRQRKFILKGILMNYKL